MIKEATDRGRRSRDRGRRSRGTEWEGVGDMSWRMRMTEGAAYFKENEQNENGGRQYIQQMVHRMELGGR